MAFNKDKSESNGKKCEILCPLHEIDSFNGEELKKYIIASISQIDVVIIDFTEVVYLNSSGLRELIQIMKFMIEHKKTLYLTQLSEDIMKIFIHTNLDRLFTFHDTLKDALNAVS
ncbi:MAG: STAS domain-containing protein [Deferribacteraceae bacterium]|jgi:anti-sigma B factor antagonist|nr:STAS domain-containing protein [Deferribacteraceae bacterium]